MINAKMTLTMPMDKIPSEITKQLMLLSAMLEGLSVEAHSAADTQNQINVLNKIQSIRNSLTLVDANLEDCYTILVGYLKYEADMRMKDIRPQEQTNDKQPNG